MPDPHRTEPRDATQGRLVVLVCVLLIAAQLGFRGWAVFSSWFQFDDVVFISRLYDQPWSWDLVGAGYAGHFMPAGLSLTWLFVGRDPLGFEPYAATLVALQAMASVGFLLLLRSLFGTRWGIVPALAVYLFSPITVNAFIWWAAGVNQLPLQVALTWGLLCHVAYLRTRHVRWVLATMAVLVVCLTFYEKVLLVYGAIAIVTLAWFTTGGVRARLGQVWSTYRFGLVLHVLTGAAFIAIYVEFALTLPETGGRSVPAAGLIGNMVVKSWLPSMFGGPLSYDVLAGPFQVANPADTLLLLTLLAALAFVIHVDRAFLRSRRAWVLPLFFVIADLVLVGAARASVIGSTIGLEFRYITELGLVTPLAAAFATMAVRGSPEGVEPRPDAARSPLLANREAMALATAAVVGLSLVSSMRFIDHWRNSEESREYFANAGRTLGTPDDPTPLVNVSVPQYLMWGFDYPRNTNKYVLAMFSDRFTFPDVAQDDLYVIDDSGVVRSLKVAPVVTTQGPAEGCVDRLTRAHPVTLQLTDTVDGTDWWARLPYGTQQPSGVTIEAGDTTHEMTLEPGLRNFYFRADGHFDEVRISLSGSGRWVCIGNLSLGFPQPIEPPAPEESGSAGP